MNGDLSKVGSLQINTRLEELRRRILELSIGGNFLVTDPVDPTKPKNCRVIRLRKPSHRSIAFAELRKKLTAERRESGRTSYVSKLLLSVHKDKNLCSCDLDEDFGITRTTIQLLLNPASKVIEEKSDESSLSLRLAAKDALVFVSSSSQHTLRESPEGSEVSRTERTTCGEVRTLDELDRYLATFLELAMTQ